jgi:hypothetical protein
VSKHTEPSPEAAAKVQHGELRRLYETACAYGRAGKLTRTRYGKLYALSLRAAGGDPSLVGSIKMILPGDE